MSNTADLWHLDVVAHTERMVATAMEQVPDANEARFIVHGVMQRAMNDMLGPASRAQLYVALDDALREHSNRAAA